MRWSNTTAVPIRRSEHGWGSNVRSYVVGRGVKDLRTGIEQDFEKTLDGDIDTFLKAYLVWPGRKPRSPNAPVPE